MDIVRQLNTNYNHEMKSRMCKGKTDRSLNVLQKKIKITP